MFVGYVCSSEPAQMGSTLVSWRQDWLSLLCCCWSFLSLFSDCPPPSQTLCKSIFVYVVIYQGLTRALYFCHFLLCQWHSQDHFKYLCAIIGSEIEGACDTYALFFLAVSLKHLSVFQFNWVENYANLSSCLNVTWQGLLGKQVVGKPKQRSCQTSFRDKRSWQPSVGDTFHITQPSYTLIIHHYKSNDCQREFHFHFFPFSIIFGLVA